ISTRLQAALRGKQSALDQRPEHRQGTFQPAEATKPLERQAHKTQSSSLTPQDYAGFRTRQSEFTLFIAQLPGEFEKSVGSDMLTSSGQT
ncbi:MAG: hypothetical protein VW333_07510, partial [Pseudomonadales bacterium]